MLSGPKHCQMVFKNETGRNNQWKRIYDWNSWRNRNKYDLWIQSEIKIGRNHFENRMYFTYCFVWGGAQLCSGFTYCEWPGEISTFKYQSKTIIQVLICFVYMDIWLYIYLHVYVQSQEVKPRSPYFEGRSGFIISVKRLILWNMISIY